MFIKRQRDQVQHSPMVVFSSNRHLVSTYTLIDFIGVISIRPIPPEIQRFDNSRVVRLDDSIFTQKSRIPGKFSFLAALMRYGTIIPVFFPVISIIPNSNCSITPIELISRCSVIYHQVAFVFFEFSYRSRILNLIESNGKNLFDSRIISSTVFSGFCTLVLLVGKKWN